MFDYLPDSPELLNLLHYSGALLPNYNVNIADSELRTPFIRACKRGCVAVAEYLALKGSNIDFKDKQGNSGLNYAIQKDCDKLVDILIRDKKGKLEKSILESIDSSGNTALLSACCFGSKKVVELLLANKSNMKAINTKTHENALMLALKSNNKPLIFFLLDDKHVPTNVIKNWIRQESLAGESALNFSMQKRGEDKLMSECYDRIIALATKWNLFKKEERPHKSRPS